MVARSQPRASAAPLEVTESTASPQPINHTTQSVPDVTIQSINQSIDTSITSSPPHSTILSPPFDTPSFQRANKDEDNQPVKQQINQPINESIESEQTETRPIEPLISMDESVLPAVAEPHSTAGPMIIE